MSWKRTKLSYFLWSLFVILTCVVGYYATFGFGVQMELQGTMILIIYAGVLLFGGLISVICLKFGQKLTEKVKIGKTVLLVLECIAAIALLAGGIVCRLKFLPNVRPGELYYLSMMKYGESVPDTFPGAEDLYLRILHEICFLLGNVSYFCVCFQLALNVLAGVIWYFGVRKLAGRIPALIFAAFFFLHQFTASGAVILSAESLVFFVYGIGLLFTGAFVKNQKHALWISILCGLVIGMAGYVDVLGFTLFIFAASVWHVDEKKERWISLGILFVSAIIGFFACFGLRTLLTGKDYVTALLEWVKWFSPKMILTTQLSDYFWYCFEGFWGTWSCMACVILLVLTAFAFLIREGREKISPWIGVLVATLIAVVFQLTPEYSNTVLDPLGEIVENRIDAPFDGTILILACLFVLAGIGLEALFKAKESLSEEAATPNEGNGTSEGKALAADAKESVDTAKKESDDELEVIELDELVQDASSQEETVKEENEKENEVKEAVVIDETVKDETVKEETVKEENVKQEAIREVVATEDGTEDKKTEVGEEKPRQKDHEREETVQDEFQYEETKPEEFKQDGLKYEEAKPEESKQDGLKYEEAKPEESGRDELKREESVLEENKPDEFTREEPKQELSKQDELKFVEPEKEEPKLEKTKHEKTKREKQKPEKQKQEVSQVDKLEEHGQLEKKQKETKSISQRIKDFKEDHRNKLIYYIEHPEAMEEKNFVVKFLFERAKKKYETQKEMERVMNTLISLSEDHIVWTDGVRTKQSAPRPDSKIVSKPELPKTEPENKEAGMEIKPETPETSGFAESKENALKPETVEVEEIKTKTEKIVETEKTVESEKTAETEKTVEARKTEEAEMAAETEKTVEKAVKSIEDGIVKSDEKKSEVIKLEEEKPEPLHNPLPEPKKHVATVMDYDYEVSDDDDYDYE